jgi:hypothetical protein
MSTLTVEMRHLLEDNACHLVLCILVSYSDIVEAGKPYAK